MWEGHHLLIYSLRVARQTLQNQFKGQTISGHKAAEILREGPDSEKEAQKTGEVEARNTRIATDTILQMFDNFLGTYRCKDGLLTIAGARQSDCRS